MSSNTTMHNKNEVLPPVLPFNIMIFVHDTAMSMHDDGVFDEGRWDLNSTVDAIFAQVERSAPSSEYIVSDWDKLKHNTQAIKDFIAYGETQSWRIAKAECVMLAADAYLKTETAITQAELSPVNEGKPADSVLASLAQHQEQYRGVCLALDHLSPMSVDWLTAQSRKRQDVLDRSYGFVILMHDKLFSDTDTPIDVANLIRQCRLAGYKQVMLADDAPSNPALPIW